MGIHYSYYYDTFGYRFSLLPEVIRGLPQWSEAKPFPPLSPRIAIANSRIAIQRILAPELGLFEPKFSSCSLEITTEFEGACWIYKVDWFVPGQDVGDDWATFSVPVLFDGSTPEPTKFRYEDRFEMYKSK